MKLDDSERNHFMNLNIESITISDSLEQLATSCNLEMVPDSPDGTPSLPAEFSLPGDSQGFSASNLRPTGETIDVKLAYGNTPLFTVFSGVIRHIDDVNDANRLIYEATLDSLPQGLPLYNKISAIYNQVSPLTGYDDTTAYAILEDICNQAGLVLGRIDMPDYNVWGNFEVIRQNPVEVAKQLVEPFNKFPFFKYVVRCDNNGLQIIGVDYTQGAQVSNAHQMNQVISQKTEFSIYNTENRIGGSDVLITGGDIYGNNGAFTCTGYCAKVYNNSTKQSTIGAFSASPDGLQGPQNTSNAVSLDLLDNWTETDTTIIYLIDMTINSPDDPRIVSGGIQFSGLLDDNIASLQSGAVDSIKVRETYVMKSVVSTFDSINGMTNQTVTKYTYDLFVFNNGVFSDGSSSNQCVQGVPGYDVSQIKVTQEDTTDTAYTASGPFPISYARTSYKYTQAGVLTLKSTYTYYNSRGQWILQGITSDNGSLQEATTAQIQFFDNMRVINQPDALHGAKTEIGKYQLRNGVPVPPVQLQRNPCPLSEEGNRLKEFKINNAFTMSGAYMDYAGLYLLWQLAQREVVLEKSNAYWQYIELQVPIDTSPVVGESIICNGAGGIVESVSTNIDSESAVTNVSIRRIVFSNSGVVNPVASLAGTYPVNPFGPTALVQTADGITSIAFPTGSVGSVNYANVQTYLGTSPLAYQNL